MENLYKLLDAVKEKNKGEVLDTALPFQEETTKLIEFALSKIFDYLDKVKYESYNYIRDYDEICLGISFKISFKKSDDVFLVSKKYFKSMGEFIIGFIKSFNLGNAYYYLGDQIMISLSCDVKTFKQAMMAYSTFISKFSNERAQVRLNSDINKIDYVHTEFDDSIVDNFHYKIYQEMFLDGQILDIIKNEITSTDHITFMKDSASRKIVKDIKYISDNYSYHYSKDAITIPAKFLFPLYEMINRFVYCYKLGEVCIDNRDKNYINIYLNCTLDQLMDAYYMEKQRLEHYISGDYLINETNPTAKRVL